MNNINLDDLLDEEISDETAFHLVNFFIKLTGVLESRYYSQMKHYVDDNMPYVSFCFTEED